MPMFEINLYLYSRKYIDWLISLLVVMVGNESKSDVRQVTQGTDEHEYHQKW